MSENEQKAGPRYPKVYAKVGTVPMFIWLRSRKPYRVGDRIQWLASAPTPSAQWVFGIVTNLDPFRLDML